MTGFSHVEARVDGTVSDVVASTSRPGAVLDLDVQAGGFDTTVADPVVVSVDEATAIGAGIGDAITVESANGSSADATVVALFDDQALLTEDYLFDTSMLADLGQPDTASGSPSRLQTVPPRQTWTRCSPASPTSTRTRSPRPLTSSVSGSRAWSTPSWQWSTC